MSQDNSLDELLKELYGFDETGTRYPNQAEHDEARQAILSWVEQIIGGKNLHTPKALAHLDNSQYKYACCERVQAQNNLIDEQLERLNARKGKE